MPEKTLRVLAGIELRSLAWLTVAQPPDGAVSMGFTDQAFIVPGVQSSMVVDGDMHIQAVDLTTLHTKQALTNPHFTFHPPNHAHLRANAQNYLAEELVMMGMQVEADGRVPWVTFTSRRLPLLSAYAGPRSEHDLILHPQRAECSIELRAEFIASLEWQPRAAGLLLDHVESWPCVTPDAMVAEWHLHLQAAEVPARDSATFTWFQQH